MKSGYLFKAKRENWRELPKKEWWVVGFLTKMWGQLHIINPNDENTAYPIDESTICRCTGFTDKSGKALICENDIVRHYNDQSKPEVFDTGVICWNEKFARFERSSESDSKKFLIDQGCAYEVIGNTIDNPKTPEDNKMKYELLFEKGDYALILRGEKYKEYAVVYGLDQARDEWAWTCGYFGSGVANVTRPQDLSRALDLFLTRTNENYISRVRLEELATLFKDGLLQDDREAAMEYFEEACELSENEENFFEIEKGIE